MDGFINLNKPTGISSHDAVGWMRRVLHMRRVGHTGTLDPAAAGVLPIAVGKATRLAEYITDRDKIYRAEIFFGRVTDTYDGDGAVQHEEDCSGLSWEKLLSVLDEFRGEIAQLPPMYSAIKINGRPLYKLARAGLEVGREPRRINIYSLTAQPLDWAGAHPTAELTVSCSKGTYIRSLCHDIGQRMGVGAHMSALTRIKNGPFLLAESFTPEAVEEMAAQGDMRFLQPLSLALAHLPLLRVEEEWQIRLLEHGNVCPSTAAPMPLCRIEAADGRLLAVGAVEETDEGVIVRPNKVLV